MPDVEFKLARLRDARRIALMSRDLVERGLPWAWTPQRVTYHIRDPETLVLTAWRDDKLAGFAVMQFFEERAHLNLLAVDPACRRFGIGRQLIEWLEKTARTGGVFFINLEVRAKNTGARKFYHQLGYRETKTVPGYYAGRESAICMHHDLRVKHPSSTSL